MADDLQNTTPNSSSNPPKTDRLERLKDQLSNLQDQQEQIKQQAEQSQESFQSTQNQLSQQKETIKTDIENMQGELAAASDNAESAADHANRKAKEINKNSEEISQKVYVRQEQAEINQQDLATAIKTQNQPRANFTQTTESYQSAEHEETIKKLHTQRQSLVEDLEEIKHKMNNSANDAENIQEHLVNLNEQLAKIDLQIEVTEKLHQSAQEQQSKQKSQLQEKIDGANKNISQEIYRREKDAYNQEIDAQSNTPKKLVIPGEKETDTKSTNIAIPGEKQPDLKPKTIFVPGEKQPDLKPKTIFIPGEKQPDTKPKNIEVPGSNPKYTFDQDVPLDQVRVLIPGENPQYTFDQDVPSDQVKILIPPSRPLKTKAPPTIGISPIPMPNSLQTESAQSNNTTNQDGQTDTPPADFRTTLLTNRGRWIMLNTDTMRTPTFPSLLWLNQVIARNSDHIGLQSVPRARVNGMFGYSSEVFSDAMQHLVSQYRNPQTNQWDTPEHHQQFQQLIELYGQQVDFERDEKTAYEAQNWKEYFDNNPSYVGFNQQGPAIYNDQGTIAPREQQLESANLIIPTIITPQDFPSKQARIDQFNEQSANYANELNEQKKLSSHTNSQGINILSTPNRIKEFKDKINPAKKIKGWWNTIKTSMGSRASKALSLKTLGVVGGVIGTAGLLAALQTVGWLANIARKDPMKAAAIFTWLQIQIAQIIANFISSAITFISTGVGGTLGFIVGGPVGAAGGGYLGYQTGQWLTQQFGGGSQLAHSAAHGYSRTVTANMQAGTITTKVVYDASIAEGVTIPGTVFFLSTVVGPFIVAGFLTFFVLMTIMTSFTVPNPQATQWDPNFAAPGTPGNPGSPIPPGSSGSVGSASLQQLVTQLSQSACIPTEFSLAIMQTEAAGALHFTDAQFQSFNTPDWWRGPPISSTTPVNCYADPKYNTGGTCETAYCYDNGYDVWGVTQFLTSTFYGCADPDGEFAQNTPNPACRGGYVPKIISVLGKDSNYIPNRCVVSDALAAMVSKLSGDTGRSIGSCGGAPAPLTKDQICRAARAYCGSCGAITQPSNSALVDDKYEPCAAYYGTPSDACGSFNAAIFSSPNPTSDQILNNIGYCNKVYFLYSGGLTP